MAPVPFPRETDSCLTPDDATLLDQFPRLPIVPRDDAHEYACPRWLGWVFLGMAVLGSYGAYRVLLWLMKDAV